VTGFGDTQPLPDRPPTSEENRRVAVFLRLPSPLDAALGNSP
jgi:flagellar motor protein MotB